MVSQHPDERSASTPPQRKTRTRRPDVTEARSRWQRNKLEAQAKAKLHLPTSDAGKEELSQTRLQARRFSAWFEYMRKVDGKYGRPRSERTIQNIELEEFEQILTVILSQIANFKASSLQFQQHFLIPETKPGRTICVLDHTGRDQRITQQ